MPQARVTTFTQRFGGSSQAGTSLNLRIYDQMSSYNLSRSSRNITLPCLKCLHLSEARKSAQNCGQYKRGTALRAPRQHRTTGWPENCMGLAKTWSTRNRDCPALSWKAWRQTLKTLVTKVGIPAENRTGGSRIERYYCAHPLGEQRTSSFVHDVPRLCGFGLERREWP
jgi:hypothetical protein